MSRGRLDRLDIIIQAGITGAVMIGMQGVGMNEELSIAIPLALSLLVLAVRRAKSPPSLREDASARVAELEARVAELDQLPARLGELEERLDFTERMLAQHRDPARLDRT